MLLTKAQLLSYMGITTPTTGDGAIIDLTLGMADAAIKDEVGYNIEFDTYIEYLPVVAVGTSGDELVEGWDVSGGKVVARLARQQKSEAVLSLSQIPVRELVSVYEAPNAWDTYPPSFSGGTLLVEGEQYRVDYAYESMPGVDPSYPRMSLTGHLVRRVGIWTPIGRCVKVTYKAGYTATELAGRYSVFVLAALQTAAMMFKEAKLQGVNPSNTGVLASESIDGWSQSYATPKESVYGLQKALPPSVKKMLESYVNINKYWR